jgi:hypothetical protein
MAKRGRLRTLECEYVTFDGSNTAEVEALAGKDWMDTLRDPPSVLVRNIDGHTVGVQAGWTVSRWDGTDGVITSAPGAWKVLAGEAT